MCIYFYELGNLADFDIWSFGIERHASAWLETHVGGQLAQVFAQNS